MNCLILCLKKEEQGCALWEKGAEKQENIVFISPNP